MPHRAAPPGIFEALSAVPLFAPLPEPLRRAMAAAGTVRDVAAGTVVMAHGAPARELAVVLDGHVRLTAPASGPASPPATIDVVGPGSLIGQAAITGVGTHPASAEAVDAVRLVVVDGAAVRDLLSTDMALVLRMLGSLSASLRGLLGQVNDLKMRTTAQRLAMFLIERAGTPQGTDVVVTLPFAKRVVAEKLGMTPESLSRALAALEPVGVEQAGRGTIRIASVEALAEWCGYEEA